MKNEDAIYRNDYPLLHRSKPLSPKAATLEALVISKIKPDPDGRPAQITLSKEILSKFGICDVENLHFLRDLESLKTQLITYEIDLPEHHDFKARWRTLISQFDFFETGDVRIGVDPDLTPYLIGLQKNFTICDVVEVATLSNQYAKKLYMLLKTIEYKGGGRFTFDEIKDSFGITNIKTYQTFKVFNEKILKNSLKEINNCSDLKVDWEPVRACRRIVAIDFKINKNPCHQPKLPIIEPIADEIPHEIRVFLDAYGFNDDVFIESILKHFEADLILEATQLFDKRMSNTSITNKAGLYRLRINRYIEQVISDRQRKKGLEEALQDKEMAEAAFMAEKAKWDRKAKEYALDHKQELYDQLDDTTKHMFEFENIPVAILEGLALDIIKG